MLINGKDEIYFADRDNCIYKVDGLTFLHRKDPNKHLTETLLGRSFFTICLMTRYLLKFLIFLKMYENYAADKNLSKIFHITLQSVKQIRLLTCSPPPTNLLYSVLF